MIEGQMVSHVREHFGELDGLLQSTNGIGPVASATLIAQLPELGGRLTRREIAAWRAIGARWPTTRVIGRATQASRRPL